MHDEQGGETGRQPVFNAPPVIAGLIGALAVIHAAMGMLPLETSDWLTLSLAFSPARMAPPPEMAGMPFPGGKGAVIWTFFTHMFLHANWFHLIANAVWMLAFGTVAARWLGGTRFMLFTLLCAAGGALASQLIYAGTLSFMMGASGAVSGHMGGAVRMMYTPQGRINLQDAGRPDGPGPLDLSQLARLPSAVMFIAIWLVLNLVFGLTGFGAPGDIGRIAWEAHAGGFVTGLLAFGLFKTAVVQ